MKPIALTTIFLISIFFVKSQTIIQGGDVSGTWTLPGSPYFIEGNINVPNDSVLQIEAGVHIIFRDNYAFHILGQLLAEGTAADTIVFTVEDTTGYYQQNHKGWQGIRLYSVDPSNDSSILSFCKIEFGLNPNSTGGGIYCKNTNKVRISNCLVQKNIAKESHGGGIFLLNAAIEIKQTKISSNYCRNDGGGLYIEEVAARLNDIQILKNKSEIGNGEGLYMHVICDSTIVMNNIEVSNNKTGSSCYLICRNVDMNNFTIDNNQGTGINGMVLILKINESQISNNTNGGIYLDWTDSLFLNNTDVFNNSGETGGINIKSANGDRFSRYENVNIYGNSASGSGGGLAVGARAEFKNVRIFNNTSAGGGGGIYTTDGQLFFDESERCSIYNNSGVIGKDIYTVWPFYIDLVLDTFSVLHPTTYYCNPAQYFSPDINCGMNPQVNTDLFVSPNGNDANNGLSWDNALLTIEKAISKIYGDTSYSPTIFLESGTYSPSETGENFPIYFIDHIALKGEGETILNADSTDGVIHCRYGVNQKIDSLQIVNGYKFNGAGIFASNSDLQLKDLKIKNNNAANQGGGIYCYGGSVTANDLVISDNSAVKNGGGLLFENTQNSSFSDCRIINNMANYGGGAHLGSNPSFNLKNVSIHHNKGGINGGGIYLYDDSPLFHPEERCNIYSNTAPVGNDLYNAGNNLTMVVVDTFTVADPTYYYAYPVHWFTFDINTGIVPQIYGDVYVSPNGDDENPGLSWDEPLKTIDMAYRRVWYDTLNRRNIFLDNGTFSPSNTGEVFPIYPGSYIDLIGRGNTILSADSLSNILRLYDLHDAAFKQMIFSNGKDNLGGAVYAKNSYTSFKDVAFSNNNAYTGGAMYLYDESNIKVINSEIDNNQASTWGGAIFTASKLKSIGNLFHGNHADYSGNAVHCSSYNAKVLIANSTMADNGPGFALSSNYALVKLYNSILHNEPGPQVYAKGTSEQYLKVDYTNILGGRDGIVKEGDIYLYYYYDTNIDALPGFVGFGDNPWSLADNSPCINRGNPDTTGFDLPDFDLAGNPRIYGVNVDMGAYENQIIVAEEELNYEAGTFIYPNPASEYLRIHLKSSNSEIRVFDLYGRKITEVLNPTGKHEININVKGWQKGLYMISINTEMGPSETVKLVVK